MSAPADATGAAGTAGPASAVASLAESVLRGDPRSLARAMSLVENGDGEAEAILEALYGRKPAAPRFWPSGTISALPSSNS